MNKSLLITLFLVFMIIICIESRKTSRSRSSGSGRGSNRKTNYNPQPVPTSLSYPQSSAPKPSLSGWQETPAQRTKSSTTWQSKSSSGQNPSYPSSQTGLSGSGSSKQSPTYQDSIQKSNLPNQQSHIQPGTQSNNQASHSYPSSNGLSGNVGSGSGGMAYPKQQGSGLSGAGVAPPPYPGIKSGDYNRPPTYNSGTNNNYGNNNYHNLQGPPPPYTNYGSSYGGYNGGHGFHGPPGSQMPGYFGNYANNGRSFGGVSRTGSVLTGVGIAGAGVGTILTGLALWNLARSTGQRHHTVVYDNKGQPVAVTSNVTQSSVDPILGDLVNCTLTISNDNATEVLAIPCSIATSFSPDADVKDSNANNNTQDNTKCIITVVTKAGREFMTTIACSVLLSTAAENNVTEASIPTDGIENDNNTTIFTGITNTNTNSSSALMLSSGNNDSNNSSFNHNCTLSPGDASDPINPCFPVSHNLTVIPLPLNHSSILTSTPGSA